MCLRSSCVLRRGQSCNLRRASCACSLPPQPRGRGPSVRAHALRRRVRVGPASRPRRATKFRERRTDTPRRLASSARLDLRPHARLHGSALRLRRLRGARSRVCVSRWTRRRCGVGPCCGSPVAGVDASRRCTVGSQRLVSVTSPADGRLPSAALQRLVSAMGVCSSWCGSQSVVVLASRAPSWAAF